MSPLLAICFAPYERPRRSLGKVSGPGATMIQYIKLTHEDLRAHSFGARDPIDCSQWLLDISAHAERHIQ